MVLQPVFSECRGTWIACKKVDLHIREERDGDIPLISLKIEEHFYLHLPIIFADVCITRVWYQSDGKKFSCVEKTSNMVITKVTDRSLAPEEIPLFKLPIKTIY